MTTRYVGSLGPVDNIVVRNGLVRLDENLGRLEDTVARFFNNNQMAAIDSPGEESTAFKVNKHLRLRDNKFLYWAPVGVDEVTKRSAGIRWNVKYANPDRFDFDVKTGTKMSLNSNATLAVGSTWASTVTGPSNGIVVEGKAYFTARLNGIGGIGSGNDPALAVSATAGAGPAGATTTALGIRGTVFVTGGATDIYTGFALMHLYDDFTVDAWNRPYLSIQENATNTGADSLGCLSFLANGNGDVVNVAVPYQSAITPLVLRDAFRVETPGQAAATSCLFRVNRDAWVYVHPRQLLNAETTPSFEIAQTWNTSGNPTAFKMNVTNTGSGATAKLFDWQVGGATRLFLNKFGAVEQTFVDASGGDLYPFTQRCTFVTNAASHTFFAITPNNSAVAPAVSGTVRGFDFQYSGLSGQFDELTGINATFTTSTLGATSLNGGRIILATYNATMTEAHGLDIQWGDDGDAFNFGETTTIGDMYGIRIRDEVVNRWDGQNAYGGTSSPVNQFGILVEATASGSTNFIAGAFGGRVQLTADKPLCWQTNTYDTAADAKFAMEYNSTYDRLTIGYSDTTRYAAFDNVSSSLFLGNDNYVAWVATPASTTVANADGTFRYDASTLDGWEWIGSSSWGATTARRTIYASIDTFSLPQHNIGLKNNYGVFWTATEGDVWSNRTGYFEYSGSTFKFSNSGPSTLLTIGTTIVPKVNIVPDDGVNFVFGTTTGTKFGQATNQKIGVWNATPVIQQSAYTQTYATADKTHAAFTSGDLTGITSSTTGTALAEPSLLYTQAEMQQNFRRIQDQYNLLRADLADLKQLVNSVIDDFQTIGWLG